MERVLLTAEEAAESLKVGRCKVYDLIRSGELESIKIGLCDGSQLIRCVPSPRSCSLTGTPGERAERDR